MRLLLILDDNPGSTITEDGQVLVDRYVNKQCTWVYEYMGKHQVSIEAASARDKGCLG